MSHEECRPQVARVWGQLIINKMFADFEYHSLWTTFNLTVNKPIILTHAKRRDFKYYRAYPYILQGTVNISCILLDSSTRVRHWVIPLSCFMNMGPGIGLLQVCGVRFFHISDAIVINLLTFSLHKCRWARHKSPIDVKTTYLKWHLVEQKARNYVMS